MSLSKNITMDIQTINKKGPDVETATFNSSEKSQPHKTFSVKADPENKKGINLYDSSSITSEKPSYQVAPSKHSTSHLNFSHGNSSPPDIIGTAVLHSFSNFNTDLTYRGTSIVIRPSVVTYEHNMDYPGRGRYTWAPETSSRSKELHLRFRDGPTMAILKDPKRVAKEGTELVLLESCDEEVEGFVVLSAVALGFRGHLKADVLGAAMGFGAVGI